MPYKGCRNGEIWITPDHYNRLLTCLKTGSICLGGNVVVDPETLLFSGFLLKNGSMVLGPMYDVPRGIPDLRPPGNGTFAIEFLAKNGSILSSTNFELSFNQVIEGHVSQLDIVPFAFSVAFPNATWIMRVVQDGKVLINLMPGPPLLRDAIASLPDKAFDKNPDQRRNALLNKIDAFERMLNQNDTQGAIQDLRKDIKPRIESWVVDYQKDNQLQLSKTEILLLIDRIIARLGSHSSSVSHAPGGGDGTTKGVVLSIEEFQKSYLQISPSPLCNLGRDDFYANKFMIDAILPLCLYLSRQVLLRHSIASSDLLPIILIVNDDYRSGFSDNDYTRRTVMTRTLAKAITAHTGKHG